MIRCGHCKGEHKTVAEVRSCSGTTANEVYLQPTPKQVDYVMSLQESRDLPDEYQLLPRTSIEAMDRDEVSRLIGELKALPYNKPQHKDQAKESGWSDVPAGRYAIEGADRIWRFYQVDDGKPPRWEGYKFVVMLIGAPGSYQKVKMGPAERNGIMAAIASDPNQAMTDYGLESGVCGRCSSPLSDPQSLKRGIGPKCLAKLGW